MALTTVSTAPASQKGSQESVKAAVKELQRLKQVVVAGAAAATNIAIAGIAVADVIVGCIEFKPATPAILQRTATVTSAGNIQIAGVDTTSSQLLVTYFDVA